VGTAEVHSPKVHFRLHSFHRVLHGGTTTPAHVPSVEPHHERHHARDQQNPSIHALSWPWRQPLPGLAPPDGWATICLGMQPMSPHRHAWMPRTTALGIVFATFAVWHVWLNRRAFVQHVRELHRWRSVQREVLWRRPWSPWCSRSRGSYLARAVKRVVGGVSVNAGAAAQRYHLHRSKAACVPGRK